MLCKRVGDVVIVGYFLVVTVALATVHPTIRAIRNEIAMKRCAVNLRELRRALLVYQEDYGDFPAKFGMLYPRYVTNVRLFTCPSAVPRIRRGRAGYTVTVGENKTASAYLIPFRSPDYTDVVQARAGETPVLICDQHVQDAIDEVWGQTFVGGSFEQKHGDPSYLIMRLNGDLDRLRRSALWRRKWHTSNEF